MYDIPRRLKVMLTTEGTYPYHRGGVSTWCDILLKSTPQVEYAVYAITTNPFVREKYELPPNVSVLIKVPLWGTEEPAEYVAQVPFSRVYLSKQRTDETVVRTQFLPMLEGVLRQITSPEGPEPRRIGGVLHDMYRYFKQYDYLKTFKSQCVWDLFKKVTFEEVQRGAGVMPVPSIHDLTTAMGWLYRFFITLDVLLPEVDVTHSTAAAFCSIPCVLAKLEARKPFLLTEHGVYLREQYLNASRMPLSKFAKAFLLNLVKMVSGLSYEFADQVSPVCEYNTRWERQMGVPSGRIRVIYNGVDEKVFTPGPPSMPRKGPCVACVARIDPLKDIETLIRSAAVVRESIPEVKFIIYGAPSSDSYFERCCSLRRELGLEETVIFAGHTVDVAAAYRSADVVALSSISEGFPYSVIEAMMSGKAVVATDVGGVREALEGCGIVVKPRSHLEMGAALVKLLKDEKLRSALGAEARNRALTYFTTARFVREYVDSYVRLHEKRAGRASVLQRNRQAVFAERGYAFAEAGMLKEAISQFRKAIEACPSSVAVPALLKEIARAYAILGQVEAAQMEMVKAELIASVVQATEKVAS